jgi:hypothetical protein
MHDICADEGLSFHFIRFNPDSPESNLESLKACVEQCIAKPPTGVQLEVHYLFYSRV